jgi:hypothetical protein
VLSGFSHPTSAAINSPSTVTVKNTALKSSVTAGDAGGVGYVIQAIANGGPVLDVVLTDTLPAGLPWTLGGTNASACTLSSAPENKLTCSFGDLAKGVSKTVQVSAPALTAGCPKITNQATASFNDGTGDVVTASPLTSITIKCR